MYTVQSMYAQDMYAKLDKTMYRLCTRSLITLFVQGMFAQLDITMYIWIVFIFLNDRFVMKTTTKNEKRNDRFQKQSFSKTTVFKKLVVSLTIVNDKPSLTIVNDDPSFTIVNKDPSLTIVNDDPSLTKRGGERKPT